MKFANGRHNQNACLVFYYVNIEKYVCLFSCMEYLQSNRGRHLIISVTYIHIYIYIYSSIDTTAAWKKRHFILSVRPDKMKRSFFRAVIVSILLYGCTTWTLNKWMEKKLDGNYTRMLRAILNNLEAKLHKVAAIRPPTTHHENYQSQTNQTCRTLLEKQGRAHKRCSPMDPLHG